VVKHMPGHGRAIVDTHYHLPTVTASDAELEIDLEPFRTLNDAPMGMTSHIVFEAWDRDRPATLSPVIVGDIIRGRIGFDGLLMTDDIDMKALSGTAGEKAAGALAAGCDVVLDCWGRMDEMVEIANLIGDMPAVSRARLDRAMATIAGSAPEGDMAELIAKRDALLAGGFDSVDYVELVDAETLHPLPDAARPQRLLAAARIGGTRLIDNIAVEPAATG